MRNDGPNHFPARLRLSEAGAEDGEGGRGHARRLSPAGCGVKRCQSECEECESDEVREVVRPEVAGCEAYVGGEGPPLEVRTGGTADGLNTSCPPSTLSHVP